LSQKGRATSDEEVSKWLKCVESNDLEAGAHSLEEMLIYTSYCDIMMLNLVGWKTSGDSEDFEDNYRGEQVVLIGDSSEWEMGIEYHIT
jgi:hypothetical protein